MPYSTKFYTPFGEYRIQPSYPTSDITDRGFTGHKQNDEIGLIYMNARYYLGAVGRFISADTIVPNPGNPQSFNRFSYTYNNPLNFSDPSGHCAENGDEDCWAYLESTFCNDGLCEPGEWWRWIIAGGDSIWTIDQLAEVRRGLLATKSYLGSLRFSNWAEIVGTDTRFRRWNDDVLPNGRPADFDTTFPDQIALADGVFTIHRVDDDQPLFTILHEIGHAIDKSTNDRFRSLYRARTDEYEYAGPSHPGGDSSITYLGTREGFYLRNGRPPFEDAADAFAATVYHRETGNNVNLEYFPRKASIVHWNEIYALTDDLLVASIP